MQFSFPGEVLIIFYPNNYTVIEFHIRKVLHRKHVTKREYSKETWSLEGEKRASLGRVLELGSEGLIRVN